MSFLILPGVSGEFFLITQGGCEGNGGLVRYTCRKRAWETPPVLLQLLHGYKGSINSTCLLKKSHSLNSYSLQGLALSTWETQLSKTEILVLEEEGRVRE